MLSLAYRPHHIIAVWPGEQVVAHPLDTLRVTQRGAARLGDLRAEPAARARPRHHRDRGHALASDAAGRWRSARRCSPPGRRRAGRRFAHDVAFDAEGLALPRRWPDEIDAASVLPRGDRDRWRSTRTLGFDRPWDRAGGRGREPARSRRCASATPRSTWGELDLRGKGALAVDAEGFAEGRIDLRARNWREMLDVAEAAGALGPGLAGALRRRARPGGAARRATATRSTCRSTSTAARTRLGPVPIGPAPRLARPQRQ